MLFAEIAGIEPEAEIEPLYVGANHQVGSGGA